MASKSFIQTLPKAELHLHLEGSVDPATLAELSRLYNTPLPTENNRYDVAGSGDVLTEDDVRRLYSYKDFNGFLMAFKSVTERLRSPEDYELVTYRLMQKLRQQNVVHAEVYVSVGVIRWRGQPVEPIFEGLERGRERGQRDFGVSLLWIFDAVRHFGPEAAAEVFDLAARLRERNVVGIGIGGDEARGPAEWFRDLYKKAADNGLRLDGARGRDHRAGVGLGSAEHRRGAHWARPLCGERSGIAGSDGAKAGSGGNVHYQQSADGRLQGAAGTSGEEVF